jgi:hypothetical protein
MLCPDRGEAEKIKMEKSVDKKLLGLISSIYA